MESRMKSLNIDTDNADRLKRSPRLLSRTEAAVYCGVSVPTFTLVCPISPVALGKGKRLERYDIRSLDAWLDKLSNDGASLNNDWLAKWESEHDGRARERP
jgi:hypothetical protein